MTAGRCSRTVPETGTHFSIGLLMQPGWLTVMLPCVGAIGRIRLHDGSVSHDSQAGAARCRVTLAAFQYNHDAGPLWRLQQQS